MQKDFDQSSTDNFRNSFENFFKNFWRECTEPASYESLVNRYHFTNKHESFSEQARAFLFRTFDNVVAALGCRIALRSDGNQDNIFARAIERIGGNNQGGTLFERTEIGEGKGNKNNIATLIAGHISNPVRYSKSQMTAPQASGEREYQRQGRSTSAIARATAAGPRAPISLLPVQFEVKTNFAYTSSVPQDVVKTTRTRGMQANKMKKLLPHRRPCPVRSPTR